MRKLVFLFFIYLFFSTPALAQSVDILWQGTGYIPPFYEGKMLWAKQSVITLVAIPQGLGNPANLNYKWTRNGTVLGNVSGIGKNSLTFMDAVFSKPYTIKVEIVDGNEETRAEATQVIAARDPLLLVYENHPLYGYLFNK
ncbi:MAG: hypothetical protein A3D49_00450 [Candidatus Zambryskibacteria bacterium RIFCSPHIGHO2_02_FULL_43_37]|uniref:Ig-like domain-containing protein n=1 Tax=Candidatus Zambryskibacteria bacterium RIFCSPHIGHO2_02_FULL_43_37 TaxID=1802749 RepID=A0A1G2TGE1_9BACT|nr:MAG: hypothetical protein A3D49_00450 [Candidatus Zambryskibacteria bacterium RIFCSPHIGHO2_02_FULL_43_37]